MRALGPYTYLRPGDLRQVDLIEKLLSGQPRHNRWINHQNYTRVATRRIVKEIRAHCMLAWLNSAFPHTPVLFTIRHPVPVVASQERMGWRGHLDRFTSQPELVFDHLAPITSILEGLDSSVQKLAAHWCVENLVALRTLGATKTTLVTYEGLAVDPATWTPRILDAVGRTDSAAEPSDMVARPSKMARADSVVRHGGDVVTEAFRRVPQATRQQVLEVVEACGLGALYGDDPLPDHAAIDQYWRSGGGAGNPD